MRKREERIDWADVNINAAIVFALGMIALLLFMIIFVD